MPAEGVGEPAAERWANEARKSEDRAEETLVATTLFWRVEVTNGCQGNREERTGAEPLDAAEDDQLLDVLRETSEHRADEKEAHAGKEERLAAVHVGELAVDRHRDGAGKQVDRDHPGVEVCTTQISDDLRKGGANDCLVERAQEERHHDRKDDPLLGTL